MKLKLVAILAGMSLMTSVFAAPKEINIAYVKAPFNLQNMVMKHNQMLEKELQKTVSRSNGMTLHPVPNRHRPWLPAHSTPARQ